MTAYSPLLALVTGVLEFIAAGFAFFSRGRKYVLYPVGLILLLLAGYQFMEIAVCSDPGHPLFARIAYIDITWLPPVGIWLVCVLSSPKMKWLRIISLTYFAAGAVLIAWIVLEPNSVTRSVCESVIARYFSPRPFDTVYGIFYQSGLLVMIFGAAAAMAATEDLISRKHLANLQAGILGFVLPSLAVRILLPEPEGILPSVMCHFAALLAFSLCFLVYRERRFDQGAAR